MGCVGNMEFRALGTVLCAHLLPLTVLLSMALPWGLGQGGAWGRTEVDEAGHESRVQGSHNWRGEEYSCGS